MNNNEYYDIHKTNSPPSQPSSKQKDLSLDQARQWLLLSRRKSQEMEFFYQYWSKTCSIISFDFHPPHNPIKYDKSSNDITSNIKEYIRF